MYNNSIEHWNKSGYIVGLDRSEFADKRKSHLYKCKKDKNGKHLIMDPIGPMCKWGWNRENKTMFSIFRNNLSKLGVCKLCQKRSFKKLPTINSNNVYTELLIK